MKRKIGIFLSVMLLVLGFEIYFKMSSKEELLKTVNGTILSVNDDYVIVQDENAVTYQFKIEDFIFDIGDRVAIEYTGLLDANKDIQDISIKNYSRTNNTKTTTSLENGIFKNYYSFAKNKLDKMSTEEKIAQLLLVQMPDTNAEAVLEQNQFGGYLLFEKHFENKDKAEVKELVDKLQSKAKIPILVAVDEEGGSVVRVSKNSELRSEPFSSPRELYLDGGLNEIKQDTIDKSLLLNSLGINLNLAPVVDVSTNQADYIYGRSLGENTSITSEYAKTVIEASKGGNVSYTLKHFPGYGNNDDTHNGVVTDYRTYDSIVNNDLPPFESGIEAGAEAVLVSHNIIYNIDSSNPASLSIPIHNILRNDLGFTGIIITDDLTMDALYNITNPATRALLAGNDLLIVADYAGTIEEIKDSLDAGTIDESLIDDKVTQVLAWKYYKGLIYENQK